MALRLLLDTNAYSSLKRGDAEITTMVRRAQQLLMSAVVVGELNSGFRSGSRPEANLQELQEFLASPYVAFLPVNMTTADRFGRISADLRAAGTPIPNERHLDRSSRLRNRRGPRLFRPALRERSGIGVDQSGAGCVVAPCILLFASSLARHAGWHPVFRETRRRASGESAWRLPDYGQVLTSHPRLFAGSGSLPHSG